MNFKVSAPYVQVFSCYPSSEVGCERRQRCHMTVPFLEAGKSGKNHEPSYQLGFNNQACFLYIQRKEEKAGGVKRVKP